MTKATERAIVAATTRRRSVEHAEAVAQELARHTPLVQAFMRDNFQLHLYPLRFTQDFASKLSAFEAAVKSGA